MKKKDFQWRYQISLNSSLAMLLDYIQNRDLHPNFSKTEMILQALSAYYMPLAYSLKGEQPEKIQQIAYDSVLALQRQIDRLVSQFQLDTSIDRSGLNGKVSQEKNNALENELKVEQPEQLDATGIFGLASSCPEE